MLESPTLAAWPVCRNARSLSVKVKVADLTLLDRLSERLFDPQKRTSVKCVAVSLPC